jgi:SAM-dependent methyltransferase
VTDPESNSPLGFYQIQTQTGWGRTLRTAADWCLPQPGWVTLDLGCGPGFLPALLADQGCRAFGIDIAPAAFKDGRLHPHLARADAGFTPFRSRSFHLLTAVNLLFLLPDPGPVLHEMRRLVHPGGQIVVLNPSERLSLASAEALADRRDLVGAARQTFLNWGRLAEAHHRWTEQDLISIFSSSGFRVVEFKSIIGDGLARLVRAVVA